MTDFQICPSYRFVFLELQFLYNRSHPGGPQLMTTRSATIQIYNDAEWVVLTTSAQSSGHHSISMVTWLWSQSLATSLDFWLPQHSIVNYNLLHSLPASYKQNEWRNHHEIESCSHVRSCDWQIHLPIVTGDCWNCCISAVTWHCALWPHCLVKEIPVPIPVLINFK